MKLSTPQRIFIITSVVILYGINSYLDRDGEWKILGRSPLVWCEDSLPLPELINCVDEHYQNSDIAAKWKTAMSSMRRAKPLPEVMSVELPAEVKEVADFTPLHQDEYKIINRGTEAILSRRDKFDNLDLYLPLIDAPGIIIQTPEYPFAENKCKLVMNNIIEPIIYTGWKYPGNRFYFSKDILITKINNQYKILVASYEAVRLKNAKALFTISITNFCQRGEKYHYCGTYYIYFTDKADSDKDFISHVLAPTDTARFLGCKPFLRTIKNIGNDKFPEKVIYLSADKRHNPEKLYVKLYNRVFEIIPSVYKGTKK